MNLPELIAHRGYAAQYPENTLIAFEAAITAGASFIECDVQLTADRIPVLFHDDTLERLCGRPGAIHTYSSSELQQFRAAYPARFGNIFNDIPIATLIDLVQLLKKHPHVTAFVELKENSITTFGSEQVVETVLQSLQQVTKQTVIISYHLNALHETVKHGRQQIGVVIDRWKESKQTDIIKLQPHYLFCDINGLPQTGDITFHNAKVAVFEVADPQTALKLAKRGVEMIETFAIREMLTALQGPLP